MKSSQRESDFRRYLQSELIRRCELNPRYSLRAFARQLGINSAILSTLLSKKRTMTKRSIRALGLKLELSPRQIEQFVQDSNPGDKVDKKPMTYSELTQDTFVAISDWYHDAILELTHLKIFEPDHKWLAKTLGISIVEVNAAVERLQRLGLLRVSPKKWSDVSRSNSNTLDAQLSSIAMRKYQKQIHEKALGALEVLPRTKRDHTSMMVSGSTKDLEVVKEMIAAFRHELAKFLERDGVEPDQVFQLAISFFPLTNLSKKDEPI